MPRFNTTDTLDDRIQKSILIILRLSLIVAGTLLWLQGDIENVAITILALLLIGIPKRIERRFSIKFPIEFTFVVAIFIYFSTFLGEVGGAYERFWWWDVALHITSGVVLAFAGFLILYSLYYQGKLKASPFLLSVFAVTFALGLGAIWEIFEFGMDEIFGLNMQKNGLEDTMQDLMVDGFGGVLVGWLGYLYIAKGEKNLVSHMVYKFLRANPRFARKLEQKL